MVMCSSEGNPADGAMLGIARLGIEQIRKVYVALQGGCKDATAPTPR